MNSVSFFKKLYYTRMSRNLLNSDPLNFLSRYGDQTMKGSLTLSGSRSITFSDPNNPNDYTLMGYVSSSNQYFAGSSPRDLAIIGTGTIRMSDTQVHGDLVVDGTLTAGSILALNEIEISDPLWKIGANNASNDLCTGFYAPFSSGYDGLIFRPSDQTFHFAAQSTEFTPTFNITDYADVKLKGLTALGLADLQQNVHVKSGLYALSFGTSYTNISTATYKVLALYDNVADSAVENNISYFGFGLGLNCVRYQVPLSSCYHTFVYGNTEMMRVASDAITIGNRLNLTSAQLGIASSSTDIISNGAAGNLVLNGAADLDLGVAGVGIMRLSSSGATLRSGSLVVGSTSINAAGSITLTGSANFDQSSGSFSTGIGAVSLRGDTTISSGKTFTVTGVTAINSSGTNATSIGNSSSTLTLTGASIVAAGAINLNVSGTATTTIGNSSAVVTLGGDTRVASGNKLRLLGTESTIASTYSGNNELVFSDNGQIRSFDTAHRIIFDRTNNIIELRDFGSIHLSAGASGGIRTSTAVVSSTALTLGSGINFVQSGAATLTSGTGTVSLGGHTIIAPTKNLDLQSGRLTIIKTSTMDGNTNANAHLRLCDATTTAKSLHMYWDATFGANGAAAIQSLWNNTFTMPLNLNPYGGEVNIGNTLATNNITLNNNTTVASGKNLTALGTSNFGNIWFNNPTDNNLRRKLIALYDLNTTTDRGTYNFFGFGLGTDELRYSVGTSGRHVFYEATSSTSASELLRINGSGLTVAAGKNLTLTGASTGILHSVSGLVSSSLIVNGDITANTIANDKLIAEPVSTNTANRIVLRDASGNFSAGTITGTSVTLSGMIEAKTGIVENCDMKTADIETLTVQTQAQVNTMWSTSTDLYGIRLPAVTSSSLAWGNFGTNGLIGRAAAADAYITGSAVGDICFKSEHNFLFAGTGAFGPLFTIKVDSNQIVTAAYMEYVSNGPITCSGALNCSGSANFSNGLTTSGTANINIGTDTSANTINIGSGTATRNITIGPASGGGLTRIRNGDGGIEITSTGIISIGTDNTAQDVHLGASTGAVKNVYIGSTVAGSLTSISGNFEMASMSTNTNSYNVPCMITNFTTVGTWVYTAAGTGSPITFCNSSASTSDYCDWSVSSGGTIPIGTYLLSYWLVSDINFSAAVSCSIKANGSGSYSVVRTDASNLTGSQLCMHIQCSVKITTAGTVNFRWYTTNTTNARVGLCGSINLTRIY